jgi:DNA-binding NtrC family response regulator
VEEKQFLRVGGTVPITVDVRIVVATNRDLSALVRAGSFREDLFYRLEVFPVRLPPLRARKEDIPALARTFAESSARQMRRKAPVFSAGALERLAEHDWPGNVRELRNVVERSVLLTRGETIRTADVVVGVPGETAAPHPSLDGMLDEVVERWRKAGEAARIRQALESTAGDRSRAAEQLGIPLRRLAQRIRELGL